MDYKETKCNFSKANLSVRRVSPAFLRQVIEHRTPRGHFLAKEGHKWLAVDNSTFDAWTEGFRRKHQALRWLRGEFEVGDRTKPWVRIRDAGRLISAAEQQGVTLSAEEADAILGYLEGHDYCLMVARDGATARHDEQHGDNYRGDEPYTVQDTAALCQEMNEELLKDTQDVEYLYQLRKNAQLFASLTARLNLCPASTGKAGSHNPASIKPSGNPLQSWDSR